MPQNIFPWNTPPSGLREAAQANTAFHSNNATSATTLAAASLTGGFQEVYLSMTGTLAAGATATTDTAANIIAAIPQYQRYVGFTYTLRIVNASSGAFAWTVAAGTGVTLVGTATIAQQTWREWVVTITALGSAPTVSMQEVGTGTHS